MAFNELLSLFTEMVNTNLNSHYATSLKGNTLDIQGNSVFGGWMFWNLVTSY